MSNKDIFIPFYKKQGLIKNRKISLHRGCLFHNCCWGKPVKLDKYRGIIRPHVGEDYPGFRLAVIAINNRLNEPPYCYNSERAYVSCYANRIRGGEKRGFYYLTAVYPTILLERYQLLQITPERIN
jgi:hypothetical protein